MRRLVTWIVVAPLAIAAILLSVANRELVTFSLDPFSLGEPVLALEVPLFALLFAAVFLGLVIGWVVGWSGRFSRRHTARSTNATPGHLPGSLEPKNGGDKRALLPRS
ncbi:MAG: LapA family protein [Rhizobiales bacterium]|nr:LapA family protein [Hyphomicrobiales bacterium]